MKSLSPPSFQHVLQITESWYIYALKYEDRVKLFSNHNFLCVYDQILSVSNANIFFSCFGSAVPEFIMTYHIYETPGNPNPQLNTHPSPPFYQKGRSYKGEVKLAEGILWALYHWHTIL